MPSAKPNILYLFTDQLRGDAVGYYPGSPVLTPNLDRLAAQGAAFLRCYTNSPLCVPARASLMSGQLPREHGVWNNAIGADEHGVSHVRNLRQAGYYTAVVGKTHLWRTGAGGKPGMHVKEKDGNLANWGFDYRVEVSDPIGTRNGFCRYTDYLEQQGWLATHQQYMQDWFEQGYQAGEPQPWDQPQAPVPEGEDIDSFIGRSAVDWISDHGKDKPFYLQVQFTGPHDPFDGPESWRAKYDASTIDPGITALPQAPIPGYLASRLERGSTIREATIEQRQRWRVNYYANVSLIDDWIGKIIDKLEEQNLLANTWIVFGSDHGELLGDHGLWGKACFYESAVHVPCFVVGPGLAAGQVSEQLVEHVDVPATLLDIAGAPALTDSLGVSLLQQLRNGTGKPFVVSELFGQVMLRTEDRKLVIDLKEERGQQRLKKSLQPGFEKRAQPGFERNPQQGFEKGLQPGFEKRPQQDFDNRHQRDFERRAQGDSYKSLQRSSQESLQRSSQESLQRDVEDSPQPTNNSFQQYFDLRADPDELVNLVDQPDRAEEIRQMKDQYLAGLEDRMDQGKFDDFLAYVESTGRLN